MALMPPRIFQAISSNGFDPELRSHILGWQEQPFISFLAFNETKIAKKLKRARSHDDQRDIGLELFLGRVFSSVGCNIVYEPRKKGPDFLIEYKNHRFFIEARRIRENLPPLTRQWEFIDMNSDESKKIARIISQKFLQVELGQPNFIYIRSNRFKVTKSDLELAFKALLKEAQTSQGDFFTTEGYHSAQDFIERSRFCNGVILHHFWIDSDESSQPYSFFRNESPALEVSDEVLAIIQKAISIPFKLSAGSGV
jgi:hypothetical protein